MDPGLEKKPAAPAGSSSHWTLLVVFLSLLLDLLGFTVILPLIPSMLEHYSKADQVPSVYVVPTNIHPLDLVSWMLIYMHYQIAKIKALLCVFFCYVAVFILYLLL